jgi:hypothetical protein
LKLKDAIIKLGASCAVKQAQEIARDLGVDWTDGICFLFNVITNDLERVPGNFGGKNDNESMAIRKWIIKYTGGKKGCASKRISNLPGTVADPLIEEIIGVRLTNLKQEDLEKITYAHRLGMSAENILGLMLEEYLATNLRAYGWHCAWGETVKSVDFVHENGSLLQIKNRSNSENSSSSTVRHGTKIEKWYRIKADRVEYMWGELNKICKTSHLSEEAFVEFARAIIESNPACLAIEANNPWKD